MSVNRHDLEDWENSPKRKALMENPFLEAEAIEKYNRWLIADLDRRAQEAFDMHTKYYEVQNISGKDYLTSLDPTRVTRSSDDEEGDDSNEEMHTYPEWQAIRLHDAHEVVNSEANGKTFKYCRDCKVEV